MTTSSSDRCTRISPSAVLDDRLDGKDLEWARDHLRRCEACRERVEDFREMLLRVGRLPKATVAAAAMDQAYTMSVPDRFRDDAGIRATYEISPAETSRLVPSHGALPSPIHPEVTSVPDLMTGLEREIFRDQPGQDHPMSLKSSGQPIFPTLQPADEEPEPEEATHEAGPNDAAAEGTASYVEEPPAPPQPIAWREVPVESHQPIDPLSSSGPDDDSDWARLLDRIKNAPDSEEEEAAAATPDALPTAALAESRDSPSTRNVIFGGEPALQFEDQEEGPAQPPKARSRSDTAMRLAVGFGAAGCVILAALLYEGGYLLKSHPTAGTSATAVVSPSARISPSAKASNRATASPSASHPVGTVLYSLGDGVPGNSVFRIRPGTAVSSYTRLVFDMRGTGLPSMVVSQLDPSRVQVLFKNTTLSNVPVAGISSTHIAAVEPGVQSGADASFVIDLARPVRVTAFTLPATGGYAWRLVVDLHTI